MKKSMKIATVVLIVMSLGVILRGMLLEGSQVDAKREKSRVILIDPGHGGMDGGAVSKSGTMEKDITLKIGKALKANLMEKGYEVVMTREEDKGLYTDDGTVRKKKNEDLNNRAAMKKNSGCSAFVSIHLNKFQQAQYFGAEVYYSNREDSKKLAQTIMNNFKKGITDGNKREIKPAKDMFKILRDEDNMPGVIIECGFLSNPEEEKKLKSIEYQHKLAKLISDSIETFFSEN